MSKTSKTLTTLAILAILAVTYVQAGLIDDITQFIWRYFVWGTFVQSTLGCYYFGVWGLFFDNDDGKLMQTCMDIFGGSKVTFKDVEYSLN